MFFSMGLVVPIILLVLGFSWVKSFSGEKAAFFYGATVVQFCGAMIFLVFMPMWTTSMQSASQASGSGCYDSGTGYGSSAACGSNTDQFGVLQYGFNHHPGLLINFADILGYILLFTGIITMVVLFREIYTVRKKHSFK